MNLNRLFFTVAFLSLSLGILSCSSSTETTTPELTYRIVSPAEPAPHGHTWKEWQAMWYNWHWSMPSDIDPLQDNGSIDTYQKDSSVIFLGGVSYPLTGTLRIDTTREGTIPFGTTLFFPVLTVRKDTLGGNPNLDSLGISTQRALEALGRSSEAAEINGTPVSNLNNYHIDTARFDCKFGKDNWLAKNKSQSYDDRTMISCATGDYLMIDNLSRGKHTIHFSTPGSGTALLNVTYKITVQ